MESPEQLGYHSENNGQCGRVRFKNEGSGGPKTAALFYRTQDPHRTQDSGCRTTGPGLDLDILIFMERLSLLLTVAIIK